VSEVVSELHGVGVGFVLALAKAKHVLPEDILTGVGLVKYQTHEKEYIVLVGVVVDGMLL
jgi:hypothetical protein